MTSLGETYEKLMKFIRFFVNRAPVVAVSGSFEESGQRRTATGSERRMVTKGTSAVTELTFLVSLETDNTTLFCIAAYM